VMVKKKNSRKPNRLQVFFLDEENFFKETMESFC